ncbi:MAG: hypothetical protein GX628_04525 [Clostridiales bacterium]|nr:hypothetical protein [Clostridiales bacterium]
MLKDYNARLKTAVLGAHNRKLAVKRGTLAISVVETTPVVWQGRLLRFEWVRPDNRVCPFPEHPGVETGCYRFTDMGEELKGNCGIHWPDFAFDHSFGCCYNNPDDGKMYVFGTRGGGNGRYIDAFVSSDLVHWEEHEALSFPEDMGTFNTSVCRGDGKYIMAIEIGGTHPAVGSPFTCVFAQSEDLVRWEMLDMMKYSYSRDRYTACPMIRFYDGMYYIINLESAPMHRWLPYIVRTPDFVEFEIGLVNPVMYPSEEDRQPALPGKFTPEQLEYINSCPNNNNSDYDTCEYNGKTIILYSWGNQWGREFLAMAEYDGGEEEYLKSFFE